MHPSRDGARTHSGIQFHAARLYVLRANFFIIIFRCKVQATNKVTTSLARYDSNVYGDRAVDDSKDRLIF